jgi:glutathionyl-hydroquinone reductase
MDGTPLSLHERRLEKAAWSCIHFKRTLKPPLRAYDLPSQDFAKNPELDLYPEDLRQDIDALNEWIYPSINNGVYRCGFATKQSAYNEAFEELFSALDRAENILSTRRYLCGDRLTEADIRLFVTLIRFGEFWFFVIVLINK